MCFFSFFLSLSLSYHWSLPSLTHTRFRQAFPLERFRFTCAVWLISRANPAILRLDFCLGFRKLGFHSNEPILMFWKDDFIWMSAYFEINFYFNEILKIRNSWLTIPSFVLNISFPFQLMIIKRSSFCLFASIFSWQFISFLSLRDNFSPICFGFGLVYCKNDCFCYKNDFEREASLMKFFILSIDWNFNFS